MVPTTPHPPTATTPPYCAHYRLTHGSHVDVRVRARHGRVGPMGATTAVHRHCDEGGQGPSLTHHTAHARPLGINLVPRALAVVVWAVPVEVGRQQNVGMKGYGKRSQ